MPETAHKNSQSHEDNTTPATQMKRKGGRRRRFSAEERRDRNRVAQAAFRRKRSQHIRGLEVRLMHLHCVNKQLQRSGAALRNWVLERLDGADVKVESPPGAPHKWQSQELCAALRTFEEPCPDYKFPLDASGESYDLHPQSSRSFSTSSCDFPPPQPTPDELLSKTRRASLKAVTISPQTFDSSQMRRSRSMDDGAIPMSHYVFPTPGQELQDGTEACTCGHCTYAQDDIYESHIGYPSQINQSVARRFIHTGDDHAGWADHNNFDILVDYNGSTIHPHALNYQPVFAQHDMGAVLQELQQSIGDEDPPDSRAQMISMLDKTGSLGNPAIFPRNDQHAHAALLIEL